jgi:hypothetical protein
MAWQEQKKMVLSSVRGQMKNGIYIYRLEESIGTQVKRNERQDYIQTDGMLYHTRP